MKLPLLIPLTALVAGISLVETLDLSVLYALVPGIASIAMAVVFSTLSKRSPIIAVRLTTWHHVWIALAFMATGITAHCLAQPVIPPPNFHVQAFTADVQHTSLYTSGQCLYARIREMHDSTGQIFISYNTVVEIKSDATEFVPGDFILVSGGLIPVTQASTRLSKTNINYLKSHDVTYLSDLQNSSNPKITLLGHNHNFPSFLHNIRQKAGAAIEHSNIDHHTASFLITLLTGDRDFIDSALRNDLAHIGVAHIIAVSGMHVGIIAAIIAMLLLPLNLTSYWRLRYIITVPLLWAYTLFTGFETSTLRAAIMATAAILALCSQRKYSSANALMLAAILILIFSPHALWQPGMQLSFMAVLSLILWYDLTNPFDKKQYPKLHRLAAPLAITLSVALCTWPIVLYHFQAFPATTMIANIIWLPILPIFIALGLLHLILDAFGLGQFTSFLLDQSYFFLRNVSAWLAAGGKASIMASISLPATRISVILAVGTALIWHKCKTKTSLLATFVIAALTGAVIILTSTPPVNEINIQSYGSNIRLAVTQNRRTVNYDVPPGQCMLYKIGTRKIVIADAMPDSSSISPFACHILLVGRNCPLSIKKLHGLFLPDTILIHHFHPPGRLNNLKGGCDSINLPHYILSDRFLIPFTK